MHLPRPLTRKRFLRTALLSSSLCALANAQGDLTASKFTAQTPSSATPADTLASTDPGWHTDFTLYLWFPGTHGTLGANGRNVDFRASAGDLLSHTRFGLMGAVDVQHDRFVLFTDLMWVRLEANKQPFALVPQLTAQVKANQFILNPEVGYRFLDGAKIKIDALWGARYWHLDSGLRFTPSLTGANFSGSSNWADMLMGARFQFPLSPRLLVTVLGDGGGWGAASQLDYQIVGALGLKVTSRLALDVGYRYLYIDYRSGSFIFNTAFSGPAAGITYTFRQ